MCAPSLAMSPLAKLAATPLLIYLGTYPKHGTKTLLRNNWVKKMPAGHSEHILGHTDIHHSSGSNTRRKTKKKEGKKKPRAVPKRQDKTYSGSRLFVQFREGKSITRRTDRRTDGWDGIGMGTVYISLSIDRQKGRQEGRTDGVFP